MNNSQTLIINVLNICGININNTESLNNFIFERDLLLNQDTYNKVREKIPDIKNVFSSSYLNSLHKHAQDKQKWPLINIVRQLLNSIGFKLIPIRKANGYTKDKIKLYKRFFIIQKLFAS